MIYKTHVAFAEAIMFSPFILEKFGIITKETNIWNNFYLAEIAVFVLIIAIAALLPDLDEEESWLSKKIPFVSYFTGKLQHRGLTHYLITPILILLIGILVIPSTQYILLYIVVIAYTLHIVGDAFTKSGIPNGFYPLKIKFVMLPKAFRFRTYGFVERSIVLPLLTVIIIYEGILIFSKLF